MNEIIEGVTSKYGLESSDVCSFTIKKRVTRSNFIIVHKMRGGHISPICEVEDKLVGLTIQMVRIMHSLTPSSYLQLANDFISGNQTEKRCDRFQN